MLGTYKTRWGEGCGISKKSYGKRKLEDGKPIGGRDRLTDSKIELFQKYYGKAIRNNKQDKEGMQSAV